MRRGKILPLRRGNVVGDYAVREFGLLVVDELGGLLPVFKSEKVEELVLAKSGLRDDRHKSASFDFVMLWHWDDRLASRKVDVATPRPDHPKTCLAQRLDDFTP